LALLVFGPEKLPQLARSLGESVYEFKKALRENGREKPAG
jgi:TatA/E family protein of Tat protein translocase